MKARFPHNRYVHAAIATLLVLGVLHSIILVWLALTRGLVYLNVLNILDLNSFWPGIDQGWRGWVAGWVAVAGVYLIALKRGR